MKIQRLMLAALLIVTLLVLFPPSLFAQTLTCRPHEVCMWWTAPTHNVDKTPIAAAQQPIKYRVYRKLAGAFVTEPYVRLAETLGLEIKLVGEPRGEQCYAVSAVDAQDAESALSDVVCTIVRFPGPTDGTIEAPSDGSIEVR